MTENKIAMEYVNALCDLIFECETYEIKIKEVRFLHGGFQVYFEGWNGDAICHNYSYGHESGMWETFGFPWDGDDVSVWSAEDLAAMLCGDE